MKVIINNQNSKTVSVNTQGTSEVVAVSVQGPQGPSGTTYISQANDVDTSNLANGSLLVYKTATQKWVSTTTLEAQNMDAGEF